MSQPQNKLFYDNGQKINSYFLHAALAHAASKYLDVHVAVELIGAISCLQLQVMLLVKITIFHLDVEMFVLYFLLASLTHTASKDNYIHVDLEMIVLCFLLASLTHTASKNNYIHVDLEMFGEFCVQL